MSQQQTLQIHLLVVCFICLVATVSAENWPQWRGPKINGTSTETGLPTKWDTTTNISWKLPVPSLSGSTPIVWNDHLFLNIADGNNLSLWAIDRNSGAVLWKRPLGDGNRTIRKQNMSSPSPVTDGKSVWVMTGTGHLSAFDFSGQALWTRDLQKDYGSFGLQWGYASSPLLHEGALYVQVLHGMLTNDPSYVLKIQGNSGKTVWKVNRPTAAVRESPDAYSTPTLLKNGPSNEIVVTGGDIVTGHNTDTGDERWRVNGLNPRGYGHYRIVASPIVADGLVYAPTRERPLLALKIKGRRSLTVWSTDNGPDVPTPVTDGKYFYIVRDNGTMWCLDAKTGNKIYGPQRLASATYSSSPVLADGKIYISNEDGLTTVVKAGSVFQILAQNSLEGYTLSSPAISDGQIFIRTADNLWAIGKRRKNQIRESD